jgi:histone deacetylase 1/2
MDNANSREYLDKILIQVLENMRRTMHAPSVQKTDVPREGLGMNDEDEAALDDEDEDLNPDTRHTQRRADLRIEKNGELSDSEDDDDENAPGRNPRDTRRARLNFRNIMDVGGIESGLDTGSGMGTPQQGSSLPDDEMNLDADETGNPTPSPAHLPNGSGAASGAVSPRPNMDGDDVEMDDADAAPAPSAAPIQQTTPVQETVVSQGQIATPPDSPHPQPQTQPTVSSTNANASSSTVPSATEAGPAPTTSTAPTISADPETAAIQTKMDEEDKAIKAEEDGRMSREIENANAEAKTEAAAKREEDDGPGMAGT